MTQIEYPVEMSLIETARTYQITNSEQYTGAAELAKGLKELEKEILSAHDPVVEAANKAHKAAVEARKNAVGPVQEAQAWVRQKMNAYNAHLEQLRREEQERLRREAEELAKKKYQEELAERQRKEAEAREAIKATTGVTIAENVSIIQEPEPVLATPAPAPIVPKVEAPDGVSYREQVKIVVTDPRKLVDAIIIGSYPISWIKFDESAIRSYAVSSKATDIPGVNIQRTKEVVLR